MRLLVEQLSPADVDTIEQRMRPGAASTLGFLAPGERLRKVIARDEAACAKRKIRPEQIADRLETIVGRALRQLSLAQRRDGDDARRLSAALLIDDRDGMSVDGFWLSGLYYCGLQECPFSDECGPSLYSAGNFTLHNVASRRCIKFPGLIFHLIRDHHFFEGKRVPYRLDPAAAIDALELQPGVDYAPTYVDETVWCRGYSTDEPYEEALRDVIGERLFFRPEDTREIFDVAPGVRILWNGEECIACADRDHMLDEPRVVAGVTWPAMRLRCGTSAYRVEQDRYVE